MRSLILNLNEQGYSQLIPTERHATSAINQSVKQISPGIRGPAIQHRKMTRESQYKDQGELHAHTVEWSIPYRTWRDIGESVEGNGSVFQDRIPHKTRQDVPQGEMNFRFYSPSCYWYRYNSKYLCFQEVFK